MSDPTNEERVKETLWAFGDAGPDDIDELLEQLPKGVQTSLPDSAGRPYAGLTALGIAAGFNADPRVTRLLLARHMASPDGAPGQRTPLMSAASSGRADVCQMLIEAGADLNLQNKYGFTALHIACTRGELEVAQALVEAGACTDIQTKDESTPLHFAIEDNHPDLAWVVRSQSAIQAINHSDQRAFDLARERSLGSDGDLLQVLDTGAIQGRYWTQITAIGKEEDLKDLMSQNCRDVPQLQLDLRHDSPYCAYISDAEIEPLNTCMPDGRELFALTWSVVTRMQPPTRILVDDLSTSWEQLVFCIAYDVEAGQRGVGGFTIHAGATAWDDHGTGFKLPTRPTDENDPSAFLDELDDAVDSYKSRYLSKVLGWLETGRPFGMEPLPWQPTDFVELDAEGLDSLAGHPTLSDSVTRLSISNAGQLKDLSGLEQCPRLTHLDMGPCYSLASLEGLARCTELISLYVFEAPRLSRLSGLEACTRLLELWLTDCEVLFDLSALRACTRLRRLDLEGSLEGCPDLQDLDFLQGCSTLKTLVCSFDHLKSISALASLPELTELGLGACLSLSDISPLADCHALKRLNLAGVESLQDIWPLADLKHLQHLDLSHCTSLRSVAALSRSCSLELLDVSGCNSLGDLELLSQMDRVAIYPPPSSPVYPQAQAQTNPAAPNTDSPGTPERSPDPGTDRPERESRSIKKPIELASGAPSNDLAPDVPEQSPPPPAQLEPPQDGSIPPLPSRLRDSQLNFTETAGIAATRLEFGESGRQQIVCLVTDPNSTLFKDHGRLAVYSVIKGDASGEEILNAMSAVGSSASLGAFRSVEGQLLYHAELNADATTDEIERVVITCGKIADACEALLAIETDRF